LKSIFIYFIENFRIIIRLRLNNQDENLKTPPATKLLTTRYCRFPLVTPLPQQREGG